MARAREEGARSFWLTLKEMRTGRRDLDDRDVTGVKSGPRTQCTDRSLCCPRFVRGKRRSGVDTSGDCGLGGLLETGHESALLCGRDGAVETREGGGETGHAAVEGWPPGREGGQRSAGRARWRGDLPAGLRAGAGAAVAVEGHVAGQRTRSRIRKPACGASPQSQLPELLGNPGGLHPEATEPRRRGASEVAADPCRCPRALVSRAALL